MATDFPGWTFDPNRNEYYYYSAREECWIYQSGQRIHASGATTTAGQSSRSESQRKKDPKEPRTTKSKRDVTNALASAGGEADSDESLTDKLGGLDLGGAGWIQGPNEGVTDPELVKIGVRSQGLLKGNYMSTKYQKLHPDFKTRKPGRKFFVRGKVFKALWPETLGDTNESVTTTRDSKFGEGIATKIRWFVVVKEGRHFCTCLPIVTYNRRGVAKPGVVKENHAIAYSSAYEPLPETQEMPSVGENPMLPGIRIRPKSKRDKIDKMARIDFARMYTVEHKIKAYYFGDVEAEFLERLIQQWVRMIAQEVTDSLLPFSGAIRGTSRRPNNDDDESEESEDESDDYDEDNSDDDVVSSGPRSGSTTTGASYYSGSSRYGAGGSSSAAAGYQQESSPTNQYPSGGQYGYEATPRGYGDPSYRDYTAPRESGQYSGASYGDYARGKDKSSGKSKDSKSRRK